MIDFDNAVVVAIPVTAGFGEVGVRECMLLEGPQGWGEFSPPHDVHHHDARRWLTAGVEPGTVGWPDPVRGRIAVAVQVPAVDPAQARELVRTSGCGTADVTVGDADDVARVEAVRDALGPAGKIRCTAPGGSPRQIAALERAAGDLEFVTLPSVTNDELAAVRRTVDVRLAGVDLLVLNSSELGGVRRALRIAEKSGLPCVVSAGRETSIGLSAAVALAGALPELPFACAVSRPPWVSGDVVADARALVATDGYLPVAPMPPAPDPELLSRFAVTDPGRLTWWRERLARAR
ncbi:enolase C-terminal domain-like protein [soil metagenome]